MTIKELIVLCGVFMALILLFNYGAHRNDSEDEE